MTKATFYLTFLSFIFSLSAGTVHGLESLSSSQMKQTVAQSGIDISVNNVPLEKFKYSLGIINPDDRSQYLILNGIHRLTSINIGQSDVNGDGKIEPLRLDVGTDNDQIMLSLGSPDVSVSSDFNISGINFDGADLGSVSVASMDLSSVHLRMGPHESSGIDYQLKHNLSIDSLSYQYNTAEALTFSGINVTGSFSGTLEDPGTWTPSGTFQIGNIEDGRPATIDIATDTTQEWVITDSDGNELYRVDNPRKNKAYAVLNMPMKGSIRVEDVSFGDTSAPTSLGMIAIDNMDIQKLYIEIPGRGLGIPK